MQIAYVSYCFSGLLLYCHHLYCLYVSLPYLAAALAGFFLDFPTPVVGKSASFVLWEETFVTDIVKFYMYLSLLCT